VGRVVVKANSGDFNTLLVAQFFDEKLGKLFRKTFKTLTPHKIDVGSQIATWLNK
jgi:hypothetical protein